MIGKALASDADLVILDLEDAVAPSAKDDARGIAAQVLREAGSQRVGTRINAADSLWYLADLAAVGPTKPSFVMLPKCNGAGDVVRLGHQLDLLEAQTGTAQGSIDILPLITESAASALRCDFAGASPRLSGLCFAAEDLSTDLGIAPRSPDGKLRAPLSLARATTLLAARAAGVPAIDTPYPTPADVEGLGRDCANAVADGFSGKLCIHPGQLAIVNEAFSPSSVELDWSQKVVAAFEAADAGGVRLLDGKMVDRPHLERARFVLKRAELQQRAGR